MRFVEVYTLFETWKRRLVKESTMATYGTIVRRHLLPRFGEVEVAEIGRAEVAAYAAECLDVEGATGKAVRQRLVVLRMVLQYAARELAVCPEPPAWGIRLPLPMKGVAPAPEIYTEEEVQRITATVLADPTPEGLGVMLSLYTGMRIGEVCALRWGEIDLRTATVHVRHTVERLYDPATGATRLIMATPKTQSSVRAIPLLDMLLPLLGRWKGTYPADCHVTTCSRQAADPTTFRRRYRRVVERALGEGKALRFHACRHTFATRMITGGVDAKTVASILGHSDVSTTLNVYCRPSLDEKREAMRSALKGCY